MNRMMVDLETTGLRRGSAILTIGVVVFNPQNICAQHLMRCNPVGYINFDTVKWWFDQSREAIEDAWLADEGRKDLQDNLNDLADIYHSWECAEVWSHGSDFDITTHLSYWYEHYSIATPWSYRQVRDTRTLFSLVPGDVLFTEQDGVPHKALDDALRQARQVQEALRVIRVD